jgi:hypothetical protein
LPGRLANCLPRGFSLKLKTALASRRHVPS